MTYLVTDNCAKCKYTDCVQVCPVDCFYEGPNFLVIKPSECIDCGVCVPECPAEAIIADNNDDYDIPFWESLNERLSEEWPNITEKQEYPEDADQWNRILNPDVGDKTGMIEE